MNHLFKTNEIIYESANSVIYRGFRFKDKLPVVLKKMNRSDLSPIHLSRFHREFNMAARFNHPGIIRVYDILEGDEGSLFMAMEDCGGESVHRYSDYFQGLTLEEQLNMACRIAEYLEHIHALKIIHLDINPSNIVWSPDLDLIKIIDFGISSELSPEIEFLNPSALEGTLAYMSPEQTGRMNRPIDYRTDLYSLGVTFYELFTGKLPFSDDDPIALIHAHIAITPPEASQLNKNLPDAVSQIISKLMAKDADDRYQSAAGVKHDLRYCKDRLAEAAGISSFKIASHDVSTVFKVPQKHYFRERENSMLISAFEDVCESGKCRLTLVAGHAGVGKSVFAGEIVKQVIEKNAFYITGKFNEMEPAIPHAVIIQAFGGLCEQLLSDTQEGLTYWRNKINEAVYPNGGVITDVIPIAKYLITDQPPLLQLEPKAARNRFNQCFFNLIQVVADSEHPLVLFLDDLQWADNSIFSLLDRLLFKGIKYLHVIGTYRSNAVTHTHPLNEFIQTVSQSDTGFNRINLLPFDLEQTTKFVIDAFGREEDSVRELSEVLFLKTRGNPFFLIQSLYSLYSSGAIHSDNSGNWIWESSAGEGLMDDVVDLMISKMRKLPDESQYIIKTATCIDSQVSLANLIIASGFNRDAIVTYLADLVAQGFLTASSTFKYINDAQNPIEVYFRFRHDRIRQAAYHLLEDADKFHLKIGLRFWERLYKNSSDRVVFDVVNQCNKALDVLPHRKRIPLAELNLKAGLKAKDASAWNQAVYFFSAGLKLLKEQDWLSSYKLAFDLHCGCAETALLVSDFKRVDALCETILGNARSLVDKCLAWDIQVMALIAQGHCVDAVHLGLEALRKLGIKIRAYPSKLSLIPSLLKTRFLQRKIIAVHAGSKTMVNAKHLAISRLLMRISTPAYSCGSTAFMPIVLQSVQMFVHYGYSPYAAFALAELGGLLGEIGDHSSAYKFGQLALSFIDREDTKPVAARIVYITTAFIGIYNRPYKDLLPTLLKYHKVGVETGDSKYAALNIYDYCWLRFMSGDTLNDVQSLFAEYANDVHQHDNVANFLSMFQQLVQNLLGKSDDPLVLTGDACNEIRMRQHLEAHQNKAGLFSYYANKTMLAYLFNEYRLAIDASGKAMRYIQAAKTKHNVPMTVFYQTLTICSLLKLDADHAVPSSLKILKRNIRKMKKWSTHSPSNFSHNYMLLMAEFFAIKGDHVKAEKFYHESVRLAKDSGIRHEIAIALELSALFYKQRGYEEIFHHYIRAAFKAYRKWGAIAKCRAMKNKYKDALGAEDYRISYRTHDPSITSAFKGTAKQQTNLNNIDPVLIVKASHHLSSSVDIDALSKKIVKTQNYPPFKLKKNGGIKSRGQKPMFSPYKPRNPNAVKQYTGVFKLNPIIAKIGERKSQDAKGEEPNRFF